MTAGSHSVASALSAICARCPYAADDAIDIHRGLQRQGCPGRCVRAFFRLAEVAGEEMPDEVLRVRTVLRERVCIQAAGEGDEPLETVGFEPEAAEDMESFCHRVMRMFFFDRVYAPQSLRLRFCYR